MQGVIKAYDPETGIGVLVCDTDLADYDLASDALEGSIFRMVRQGQRVVFDLDDAGRATRLRLGSEVDMGNPRLRLTLATSVPRVSPRAIGENVQTLSQCLMHLFFDLRLHKPRALTLFSRSARRVDPAHELP
jgi:cold shock CspA family protein